MIGMGDETYSAWEDCGSFETRDGRTVYLARTLGRGGSEAMVRAFDTQVDVRNRWSVEQYGPELQRHVLGELKWWPSSNEINYVWTNPDPTHRPAQEQPWERQGIGRAMLRVAREAEPSLRHAPCTERSEDGERFTRGTDRHEACRGNCEPDCQDWASQIGMPGERDAPKSVRPPSTSKWAKAKALIGFRINDERKKEKG